MNGDAGFSTVEAVVALTLLSLAAVGTAGALSLTARAIGSARQASELARQADQAFERLGARLEASGGSCGAVGPGSIAGAGGAPIAWTVAPAAAGVDLTLVIGPAGHRQRSDTLWRFFTCR